MIDEVKYYYIFNIILVTHFITMIPVKLTSTNASAHYKNTLNINVDKLF